MIQYHENIIQKSKQYARNKVFTFQEFLFKLTHK